jgi:hypothetical protein
MKRKLATPTLIACVLFLGFLTGVGIFQHMFWIPEMFESPTALANNLNSEPDAPQKFWIPLHALTFLTMVASVIFNWKIKNRKKLVLYAFIAYMYISLISIYFANELFSFQEIHNTAEFVERTNQWLTLSWHRPILMVGIEVVLLIAISKCIRNAD